MPDAQALLHSAESLSQAFRTRSDEFEENRRIPADVSALLAEAGFYRLGVPAAVGGLECSPVLGNQLIETLAQGDASCAWVAFIAATSGTVLASLPESAANDIFTAPDTMITGVFAPTGKAEKVEGGFKVSGRWQWGSGSQNADWVLGGCQLLENGEPMLDDKGHPRTHMLLMPASELEFHDTWHTSGLCGTGSLDYSVENLFVPENRVVGYLEQGAPSTPLYAFPSFTFLALGIAAVCLGMARAAIDELVELAAAKRRVGASKTIAEQPATQVALAQAEAQLRSARAFYFQTLEAAWESAQANNQVSIDERRDMRLATTHAVNASVAVVEAMYNLGGGSAVYKNSRLQRYFRDIHVAKSHIMVAPATLETIGRLFFGLPTNSSRL
ncbi:MAG: acyl-CoA dehydrogenase family protein [Halieaceae bacterium]